ncbi:hypothetical protein D1D16_21780, partial [Salmonella enterica]|nr:hypothetical protein [Salmonella enterica]
RNLFQCLRHKPNFKKTNILNELSTFCLKSLHSKVAPTINLLYLQCCSDYLLRSTLAVLIKE